MFDSNGAVRNVIQDGLNWPVFFVCFLCVMRQEKCDTIRYGVGGVRVFLLYYNGSFGRIILNNMILLISSRSTFSSHFHVHSHNSHCSASVRKVKL